MRLEFTYELADFRELRIPEMYDANPVKYRRRWLRSVVGMTCSAAAVGLYLWIKHSLPTPAVATAAPPAYDPRTELLPALIPGSYVCAIYVLTLIKTWQATRERDGSAPAVRHDAVRIAAQLVGVALGIAVWFAIAGAWEWHWQPSRTQIVLVTIAPWAVLIVLMQVLGAYVRRGKVVAPWRTNPATRRRKTFELDETGLRIQDAVYRFECEWSYVKRVRETLNLLVLIAEGGAEYVVPKRAFADPSELERCRSLLQNVVSNTRFLVKPIGFAVLPRPVLPLPEYDAALPGGGSLTQPQGAGTMQPANGTELQK